MLTQAIFKVLPILLLLALGYWLGRRNFLSPGTLQDLKKLVVNISLPAALFLAFAQVNLEARLLLIPAFVFSGCVLVLLAGRRLGRLAGLDSEYARYLMAGFEAGMLGYAIFAAVYGQDNLYKFGVVDLGQVVFVFFILVPTLKRQEAGQAASFGNTLLSFLKTPVILAILGGIVFNQLGLHSLLSGKAWFGSLQTTLQLIAGLTTPLVTLIIGGEIRLEGGNLSKPARTILLRYLIWIPAALALSALVVGRLLGLDTIYQAAVMTMAILPPPFVIPLFMQNAGPEERAYVGNTLSLATVIALVAYVFVTILIPAV
jgi:malate permease and related proteins